jgi:3-oxoadipate enol-lactonase
VTEPERVSGAGDVGLAVEAAGEGPPVVLAHGLTAHRDLVVHGSRALERAGHLVVRYDARGHGDSDAAAEGAYDYEDLADDLEAVIAADAADAAPVAAGHSMGAHTILTAALRDPDAFAGLVVIGPVFRGAAPTGDDLREWDELADGLEDGGVDGFMRAYESHGVNPEWRDTILRFTRARLERHAHPKAVALALREVPRSEPFAGGLEALAALDLPVLVVASRDDADSGHPLRVAEAYAEALPDARLICEEEGESPLAWQGGKLSREIAAFCAEPRVAERR